MKKLLLVLLLLSALPAEAKHKMPEKWYQKQLCDGAQEVRLSDGTRVDCLTDEYAVEFDFAPKWAEAIGQSLHYARMSGKKPGIVLIAESKKDWKYLLISSRLCEIYGITLWVVLNF